MTEMLLLGAGASIEAGVPGAYGMTQQIADRFRKASNLRREAHVISFVIGGLLFEAGMKNTNPLSAGVNVEELFNAVQLLAERDSLEVAPFVGSWHPMVAEFDKARPSRTDTGRLNKIIYSSVEREIRRAFEARPSSFDADRIDTVLTEVIGRALADAAQKRSSSVRISGVGRAVEAYLRRHTEEWCAKLRYPNLSGTSELDSELAKLVDSRQDHPGDGRIFHQTNAYMIATLKDLVWIESSEKVAYLNPVINLLQSQGRLTIATLNYDNSIELMAGARGIKFSTGIDRWSSGGEFISTADELLLLKLHGSIDWVWAHPQATTDRPMPHAIIRKVDSGELKGSRVGRPAVIFGQRNKLTAEGPFLELLRAFQRELSRADVLTVVGYSFRDPHINVYISQWLNGSNHRMLRIVNGPNFDREAAQIEYGLHLLRLARTSKHRVEIRATYAGEGLLAIYGTNPELQGSDNHIQNAPQAQLTPVLGSSGSAEPAATPSGSDGVSGQAKHIP